MSRKEEIYIVVINFTFLTGESFIIFAPLKAFEKLGNGSKVAISCISETNNEYRKEMIWFYS